MPLSRPRFFLKKGEKHSFLNLTGLAQESSEKILIRKCSPLLECRGLTFFLLLNQVWSMVPGVKQTF